MLPKFITGKQAVAIDLGNTTTKVKTTFNEFEAASQYVDITDSVSERVPLTQQIDDIAEFQLPDDPTRRMLWGTGIASIRDTTGLTETRSNDQRYLEKPFRNLMEMILGYIAYQEETLVQEDLTNTKLRMDISIGLPTDDYDAKRHLENSDHTYFNPETGENDGDNYVSFLKGEHQVAVNQKVYTVVVEKVNVSDQPLGTLLSQSFDMWGNLIQYEQNGETKPTDLMRSHVTEIDYGGLTILTSQYELGYRSGKSDQINEGAYKLAQNVANRWNKSENANPKMKITIDHVLTMLRKHDPESKQYVVYYNRNAGFDVSEIVLDEIDRTTKLIIDRLKNIAAWDKSDYFFVTGGGANLINYDMLNEFLKTYYLEARKVEDSTFANVRGFFIICIKNNKEVFDSYIDYNYNE